MILHRVAALWFLLLIFSSTTARPNPWFFYSFVTSPQHLGPKQQSTGSRRVYMIGSIMSTDSTNGTSDNDINHNKSKNRNNHRIDDTMMKPEVTAALEYAHLIGQLKLTPRTGWVRKGVPRYESVADHSWRVASLALLLMQPQQQEQQQQQQQHSQTKQQGQAKNHSEEEISNSFGSLSSSSSSLSYSSLDVQRCIAIAVVHDMAESIIGDITPDDHIPDHDKKHMEEVAMQKIASILHHATSPTMTTETGSSTTTTTGITSSASTTTTTTTTTTSDYADTWLMQLFHEYEYKTTPEGQVVKDLDKLDMILQADEYEQSYTDVDLTEFFTSTPICSFSHPFIQRIAKAIHERRQDRIVQQHQQSSVHDLSLPQSNDNQSRLSDRDQAFISEYAKASTLSSDAIDEVIQALRAWENR